MAGARVSAGEATRTGRIAIVNTGASSLKLALFDCDRDGPRERRRVGLDWQPAEGVRRALHDALDRLDEAPDAFGHRFVHPGPAFADPVTVDSEVEAALEAQLPLAPLHNGVALAAIRAVRERYPSVPSVAAFDTAFHAHRPPESMRYALPDELVERFHFRRYGFHGFAHASLVESLADSGETAKDAVSAVSLHLGAGCSACAVSCGRSIETSMGFTPLDGLVMATRSGSVDPAIVLRLMRAGFSADRIENELTRRAGLLALAGLADMRDILAAEARGERDARFAIDLFCRQVVLTAGAYLTLLGGEGAIVFGGGIGTNSPQIRKRIASGLSAWNVALDRECNEANEPGRISANGSREVYCFRTDEEAVIAREVVAHLDR